jgi:hypothetical protein
MREVCDKPATEVTRAHDLNRYGAFLIKNSIKFIFFYISDTINTIL